MTPTIATLGALLASSLLAGSSQAQLLPPGDPTQGKTLADRVCAACHGGDGNSRHPAYPNLAGQSAVYLYDQLLAFKAQGHRRADGVMGAIAVNLTDFEMRNAAAYFAGQVPTANVSERVPASGALLARGESAYRDGIKGTPAVPACASCHGSGGAGLPPEFPRVAGQYQQYLVKQLVEFRSDARDSDPNRMMRKVAHKLSDRDIQALAHYIARLQ